jgi:hypothetical protein
MTVVSLTLPPGIVRPTSPLQAAGRYYDANLIRWRQGKLVPVGGWQRISNTALSSTVRAIYTWANNSDRSLAALGCDDNLYAFDGNASTYTDITPTGFVGSNTTSVGGYGAYDYGSLLYGDDTDATYPRPPSALDRVTFSWTIAGWGEDILAVASSDGRLLHWEYGETEAHPVGSAAITTAERVSNVVTVTTEYHHDFQVGDSIEITGNSESTFNGTFTITSVPTDTTFTFSDSGTDQSGTGGTATHGTVPVDNTGVVVTTERHAVLFGCGGEPRRVAWSDQEDYSDWDFANSTSLAGFFELDTDSPIQMAVNVREGVLIWTEDEAWLMRYVGSPFVYGFERIGQGCGLMAPQSFATTAGRCVWMGRENFWIYEGGAVTPLACDVASYVFEEGDKALSRLYTHGSQNNVFPEVWFWFPSEGSDVADRYVIWNYAENWWSLGQMTRTASTGAGAFPYPMTADDSNEVYFQEYGWTDSGASLVGSRYAESGSLNSAGGQVVTSVRQAMTNSGSGYDSTNLTFYGSFTPDGTESSFGPYSPRSDGYTDVRFTARDFRVRFEATQDAEWSVGGLRLDVVQRGGR